MSAEHALEGYRSLPVLRARLLDQCIEEGRMTRDASHDYEQHAAWKKKPLERLLVEEGLLTEEELIMRLAALTRLPRFDAQTAHISQEALDAVPARAAVHYRIMPLSLHHSQVVLATDHVRDPEEEAQLRVILGRPIGWMLCTPREMEECITHYYGIGISTFLDLEESASGLQAARTDSDAGEAQGIPALVNDIMRDAIRSNATDIHVEPEEDRLRIRYRIDGVLYDAPLPRGIEKYQKAIISSLKVMAQLNIAERRLPQDGRMEMTLDDQSFDIRVSVLPIRYGESVQLRILNREATFLRMDELGLEPGQREEFEELLHRPHGLMLFTGPTGSGKTTSLYAGLAMLNDRERKIITIEDPVEYQIRGVTQLQVQPAIGFTFASGLRSILRHDPDVILVGEIRDDETADIAVSAALTGHLVLSTLHTNDTASSAMRLVDMGIEPYLVASSLQGIVAQRLIRRICPHCREEMKLDAAYHAEVRHWFPDWTEPLRVWKGKGCPYCRFTGYLGRRAMYEALIIDDEFRSMIIDRAPSSLMMRRAVEQGVAPLRKTGWRMALAGETTLEDVLRVTGRVYRAGPSDPA
jgi:type II secretory ATPase GspE/PulE/Tfp pilus assembly ATPase PilB-like protein